MERKLHIIDSGAFSLWNLYNSAHNPFAIVKKAQRTGLEGRLDHSFYKTKEFYAYVDEYAAFLKKWKGAIDHFITVDAIRDPKLSWKITRYLEEKHGLSPIPVVHFGSDKKYLIRYLNAGYKYIGLGGKVGRRPYERWADDMWQVICDSPNRLPVCKVHGFALTTHDQMTRYPWYSCDSTTAKKMGYYGQVIWPGEKKNGEWYWRSPYTSVFTDTLVGKNEVVMGNFTRKRGATPYTGTPCKVIGGKSPSKYFKRKREGGVDRAFLEWLEFINVPLGRHEEDGTILELGVTTCKQERVAANIKYFLWLQSEIPKWPWSYPNEWTPTKERKKFYPTKSISGKKLK